MYWLCVLLLEQLGHWPQSLQVAFHDHPHHKRFLNKNVQDVMTGSSEHERGVEGVVTVVLWNMVLPENESQEVSAHFGVREGACGEASEFVWPWLCGRNVLWSCSAVAL